MWAWVVMSRGIVMADGSARVMVAAYRDKGMAKAHMLRLARSWAPFGFHPSSYYLMRVRRSRRLWDVRASWQ